MSASRLLSIVMTLQGRERVSARALADEFEVSVRTVYRDVDRLSAAGVPVYAERGRSGGFRLLDGWRTDLTGLTADEARALFMTGLPGPTAELGLGDALAAGRLKLEAALPADWRADARRMSARFHLDPVGWYRSPARTGHLRAIADAVWSERVVSVRYESWNGVGERDLEPLGLVLKGGEWYLVARSVRPQTEVERRPRAAHANDARTYKISNILSLEPSGRAFERPAHFDLPRYWAASTRRFEAGLHRASATICISPRGARALRDASAVAAEALAVAADSAPRAGERGDWITVTIPIESTEHAAGDLLRLGAEVEVLAPPELRSLVAARARAVLDLYEPPPRKRSEAPGRAAGRRTSDAS